MWRTQQYKLILVFNDAKEIKNLKMSDVITGEFYDLKEDPREWNDLYKSENINIVSIRNRYVNELLNHLKSL